MYRSQVRTFSVTARIPGKGSGNAAPAATSGPPAGPSLESATNLGHDFGRLKPAIPSARAAIQRVSKRKRKPKSLRGTDTGGSPLSAHHLLPLHSIDATFDQGEKDKSARERLEAWADAPRRQASSPLSRGGFQWTRHNLFLGPTERSDDPGEQLDTHFTKSGTATPRSELALDIASAGGISKFDAAELRRRLEKLGNRDQPSAYAADEWRDNGAGGSFQVGRPEGWSLLSVARKRDYVKRRSIKKKRRAKRRRRLENRRLRQRGEANRGLSG